MNKFNPCHYQFLEKTITPYISILKILLSTSFFLKNENIIAKSGNIAGSISAFTMLIIGVRGAIKEDSFNVFVFGVSAFFTIVFLQYVAIRFISPAISSVQKIQTSVSDSSILDAIAVIFLLSGISVIFFCIYFSIELDSLKVFITGLGVFLTSFYASSLYINPSLLNTVIIDTQGPAEDGIGVFSSFIKTLARLTAVVYGLTLMASTGMLLGDLVDIFQGQIYIFDIYGSVALLVLGLIFPIFSYLIFISSMLCIQIIKSILSLAPDSKALITTSKTTQPYDNP